MPNIPVWAAGPGLPKIQPTITPTMRALLEEAIESLLLFLDELDGDPDLEDGADDEPSLSRPLEGQHDTWGSDDREHDVADDFQMDPAESGIADMDGAIEQGCGPAIMW